VVSSHWRRRPGGGTGRAAHSVALSACALRDRRLGYCSRGADPAPGRASAGSGAVRLFFAGIAIASVYGGRGPGLLAALLAAATGNYFFIRPFGQFALHGSALIATCLSLISGVVVAIFCGALRKSLDEANAKAAALRGQAWIMRGQAELASEARGELSEETTASQILSFVAHYLGAKLAVLYVMRESGIAERAATFACASSGPGAPPDSFQPGEGWVGRVAIEGKLASLSNLPEEHVRIVTATGESQPRHLVIAPLLGEAAPSGSSSWASLRGPVRMRWNISRRSLSWPASRCARPAIERSARRFSKQLSGRPASYRPAGGAASHQRGAGRAEPRFARVAGTA